jgi:hypothetical protein
MQKTFGVLLLIGGLVLGSLSITGWGRAEVKPPPTFNQMQTPRGHEQPDGGTVSNVRGWNLYDAPGCPIASLYGKVQTYLGPPVGSFSGKSQDFLFGRIICVQSNGPENQAMLDDVGRQLLLLRGVTPQPGSEPDPVVHRWLLNALQTGYDTAQIAGRVISPVMCTTTLPKSCSQALDKIWLTWTPGPDAVAHAEPAGCLLEDACDRLLTQQAAQWESRSVSVPLLALAAILAVAGIVLVFAHCRPAGTGRGLGTA